MRTRRYSRAVVAAAAAVAVFLAATSATSASLADVDITRINGVQPSAEVIVSGGSMKVDGTATVPTPALLVDAGDSVLARRGEKVRLEGMAWGASDAAEFAWSGDGATFANAQGATTELDTAAMEPGTHELRLTVTDTDGTSASDTVLALVGGGEAVVVDAERATETGLPDEMPIAGTGLDTGGTVDGQSEKFDFAVPAGMERLDAVLDWGDAANDYDMELHGPSPSSDGVTGKKPERITVEAPSAGDYAMYVNPYLTTPDTYHLHITTVPPLADPRPVITTGGPFRFESGERQVVTASVVTGGSAAHSVAWDLDMDGLFDTSGTEATTAFPLGSHLVTAKVTDAAGFERREVTAVRVVVAGQRQDINPFVVIAVNDSGINPYHDEFSADTYPDPRVLAVTENFTRHPSEYLPGYPKDAQALNITLDNELFKRPGAKPDELDNAAWSKVELGKLYWIPGTKIIGALDHTDASATDRRILDDDASGHGTMSAGVALGNVYGNCPMCLLVSEETLGGKWAYDKPWIDFVTNSWGARGRVGSAGLLGDSPPVAPRESVERGQIALFSAGNGNENAFVSPNQTYGTGTSGPDWAVRVGAAERYSRKPIISDGNPAEVSSFGDGYNPTASHLTTDGVTNHSGTSSATPYTAGAFGSVLGLVRDRIADIGSGQRPGAAVAVGRPVAGSAYLEDGRLTRDELWDAIFNTAEPDTSTRHSALSFTAPYSTLHYVFQGYGLVEPQSAARALDVLVGKAPMPERADVDSFLSTDSDVRRLTWGEWDGRKPQQASLRPEQAGAFTGPAADPAPPASISSPTPGAVVDGSRSPLLPVTGYAGSWHDRLPGTESQRMWLRQDDCGTETPTVPDNPRLSVEDGPDGGNGCSSVIEAASMLGGLMYFADEDEYPATDGLGVVLDRGKAVTGTIWIRGQSASPSHDITVEIVSDRGMVGRQLLSQPRIGDAPTAFNFSIPVPDSVAGRDIRKLSLKVRTERSIGFTYPSLERGTTSPETQDWRSFVDLPLAGPLAAEREMAISVDGEQVLVTPVANDGTWGDNVSVAELATGPHTIAAQPLENGVATGPRAEVDITVVHTKARPVVQVQLLPRGAAVADGAWTAATDTSTAGDWSTWSVDVPLGGVKPGRYELYSRLVVDGSEAAISGPVPVRRLGPLSSRR